MTKAIFTKGDIQEAVLTVGKSVTSTESDYVYDCVEIAIANQFNDYQDYMLFTKRGGPAHIEMKLKHTYVLCLRNFVSGYEHTSGNLEAYVIALTALDDRRVLGMGGYIFARALRLGAMRLRFMHPEVLNAMFNYHYQLSRKDCEEITHYVKEVVKRGR